MDYVLLIKSASVITFAPRVADINLSGCSIYVLIASIIKGCIVLM
jgi:hypothetical protein